MGGNIPTATNVVRNKEYVVEDFHEPQKYEDPHLVM
jgi:hypothetical protein